MAVSLSNVCPTICPEKAMIRDPIGLLKEVLPEYDPPANTRVIYDSVIVRKVAGNTNLSPVRITLDAPKGAKDSRFPLESASKYP
jgi:hypothetical protein